MKINILFYDGGWQQRGLNEMMDDVAETSNSKEALKETITAIKYFSWH